MRGLGRFKFRTKIGLGTVAIILAVALPLFATTARMAADALHEETRKRGMVVARNLALGAVDPLLAVDFLRLRNMVDEAVGGGGGIEYAFILDARGHVVAHTFTGGFPVELAGANAPDGQAPHLQLLDTGSELIYDFAAPVVVEGDDFGAARVGLSRTKAQAGVNRMLSAMAVTSGTVLVLAVLASLGFSDRVTRRIGRLREKAESVVTGSPDATTAPGPSAHCWEIMDCGLAQCPAHGETTRRCWYLAGTLCPECADVDLPEKLSSCRDCPVYKRNRGDEIQDLAETFDVMAYNLKTHIEELTRAERILSRQQRLMRTILDSTPDFVCLVGEDMRYLAANQSFARFVGRDHASLPGLTHFDLFPPDQAQAMSKEDARVMSTGIREHAEVALKAEGGETRWFHMLLVPVREGGERVIGVLRTARDVTELKNYQGQLIQAQKMESLGKLAGGVAHEINTPLGIILGYAQLLMEDATEDASLHEDLATIERQAKACRKIVADLLDFSRQHDFVMAEMDVNHCVLEVVSLVRHTFELSRTDILTELDEELPNMIGDREKLKQVWINLLNNAHDAMPGGGTVKITSRLCEIGDKLVVTVADTGSGISEADLKRIFDPFYTTKSVGQGTGLGLAVTFGIVEDHGGRIEAVSPVPEEFRAGPGGPGAMFHVILPLWPGTCRIRPEEDPTPTTSGA